MATKVQFKLNRRGVAELLVSPSVVAEIQRRAQAVASTANSLAGSDGGHDVLDTTTSRARATVMTSTSAAAKAEAESHTLTSAAQAARG